MSQPVPRQELLFAPGLLSHESHRSERAARAVKPRSGTAHASGAGEDAPSRSHRRVVTLVRSPVAVSRPNRSRSKQHLLLNEDDRVASQYPTAPALWRFVRRASRGVATLRQRGAGTLAFQLFLALAAHRCFTRQRPAHRALLGLHHAGGAPTPGTALAEPRSRDLARRLRPVRMASGCQDTLQSSDLRPARLGRLSLSGSIPPAPLSSPFLAARVRSGRACCRASAATHGGRFLLPCCRHDDLRV